MAAFTARFGFVTMYIPTVDHTVKQLRYKFNYAMIDMRRRYYGHLKNPRVINTKFKDEVLVSLRTHTKFPHHHGPAKFLLLHLSPAIDLESVMNLYYDDDVLTAQEDMPQSSGCESANIWDDFLGPGRDTVPMVSVMAFEPSRVEATRGIGSADDDSDGPKSSVSDGLVDVDFLSAWLADTPVETPATTGEISPTGAGTEGKGDDVWARTFADAKAYFLTTPVGCKMHAERVD